MATETELTSRVSELEEVLRGFVALYAASGGILVDKEGSIVGTVGDPDSLLLADIYVRACTVLGAKPVEQLDSSWE